VTIYPLVNNTTSVLIPTANAIQYKREALSVLEKTLRFNTLMKPDNAQKQSGRTVQWYRPSNFSAASLAQDTDGDGPTQLTYGNRTVQATLGLYTDWTAVSTYLMDTSPTPDLQNACERLGYRGALRMDSLYRAVIDNEFPGMTLASLSGYLMVKDLRNARTQLANADVTGMSKFGGDFGCLASPLATYDLVNDPTAGGLADIIKYNTNVNDSSLVRYKPNGFIASIAGCHVMETTNAKVVSSGGTNSYYTYVIGDEAFGSVSLNVKAPAVGEGSDMRNRFNVHTGKGGPGPWDPTGQLGGFCSYNVYTTGVCLDGNAMIGGTYRGRIMSVLSTVG
jgi:N4-gp56 family major capsid protein